MSYTQTNSLFKIMQEKTPKNMPEFTISKSYLKLMKQITEQLKVYGLTVDESGLKNHNWDQPLKIIFKTGETEYKLSVKHIDNNPFSKVSMFIEGGKYNSDTPYTPYNTIQKITEIIKNN